MPEEVAGIALYRLAEFAKRLANGEDIGNWRHDVSLAGRGSEIRGQTVVTAVSG
jgi:hypothetical protein